VVAGSRTERSLWPWADSGFGPLPPLLVVMTVVTGVVDAVSYLALGHVFVANMTGNVVFLGFALAGADGLSVPASLVALAAFLCGAAAGGGRRAAAVVVVALRAGGRDGAGHGRAERHGPQPGRARPDHDRPHADADRRRRRLPVPGSGRAATSPGV
jgi:hypothetical protein